MIISIVLIIKIVVKFGSLIWHGVTLEGAVKRSLWNKCSWVQYDTFGLPIHLVAFRELVFIVMFIVSINLAVHNFSLITGCQSRIQTSEQNPSILSSSVSCCFCSIFAASARQIILLWRPVEMGHRLLWEPVAIIPNAIKRTSGTANPRCQVKKYQQATFF